MPGNVFEEPKSFRREAFDRFRAGNKRLAQVSLGLWIGALLACFLESGFAAHISYNHAPLRIKVLFWVFGIGYLLWVLFMQHKFQSWRNPFGQTDMDDASDWAVLLGSVAVSCVLLVAIGAFFA